MDSDIEQQKKQLENELKQLKAEIDRKLKEDRIEIYNIGKVHHKQVDFHSDPHRIKGLFGGNRTGKTVAGAVEAVCHAIGYSRFRPLEPSSGWVVSLTNDVQRDVAQKEILKWLPKKDIKDILVRHGRKDDPENAILDKIVLRNGYTIGFKTCEQGREAFQGTSLGWIWMDEEPPEDIYKECMMRLVDTRGDIWITMTPLKGLTWVYNVIYLNENMNKNVKYWFMEWEDNPWLSPDEIVDLVSTMSPEELEARKSGRFTSLCGFAFPELREEIHVREPIQEIPSWYRKYVTLDYGLDATAALWIYVDEQGFARVYREYYKSNLIISEAAYAIKKHTPANEKITEYLAPPDLWNRRQDTGKSAADIFWDNGINLTKTSNDREDGWMNVKEWVKSVELRDEQTGNMYKTARLTIDKGSAPNLWRCLGKIQKDDKNPNDVAKQPHEVTHLPDSIRCFCVNFAQSSVAPKVDKKGWYTEDELEDMGYNKYQIKQYLESGVKPWRTS